MNVRLHKEIFSDPALQADVSFLIRTMVRRHHKILLDEDISDHAAGLDQTDLRILNDSFAATMIGDPVTPSCHVVKDASEIHSEKRFGVKEAIRYVESPLLILIENGTNDSRFIRAIINLYLPAKSMAQDAYTEGWIRFENGGGCTGVQTRIEGIVEPYNDRYKFLRCYVILDGDKRYDTQTVTKYDKVKEFLTKHNIPYHILEKRCMENYLPTDSFPDQGTNRRWLKVFNSLTPRQRDYYNIAEGFAGDVPQPRKKEINPQLTNVRSLLPVEQQTFYSSLSDYSFTTLTRGYQLKDFKKRFPAGFQHPSTHRASLDALTSHQDTPDELSIIATTINSLL